MNKEQIEGLARVLDTLGASAIVGAVAAFAALKVQPWLLFLMFLDGISGVYGGFCLRKLRPSQPLL
jgi:hypothetical protein